MIQVPIHNNQPQPFRAGAIKINYIVYFYLLIILATPLYTYHMAVSKHQQPPFPHATVTNTACHYPQSTIFRWTMTTAGCFLTLIYMAVFKWFKKQAQRIEYPGTTYSWLYWPAQLSVIGYLTAIGTIDNGGTGDAHTIGAVIFFIVLFIMIVLLTHLTIKMRQWDSSFISRKSYFMKLGLCGYLLLVWVYCLIGLVLQLFANDDDQFIVIVQWNSVYVGLIWILSFSFDWKSVYLGLDGQRGISMEYN